MDVQPDGELAVVTGPSVSLIYGAHIPIAGAQRKAIMDQ